MPLPASSKTLAKPLGQEVNLLVYISKLYTQIHIVRRSYCNIVHLAAKNSKISFNAKIKIALMQC